jgi:hypothetical protein
VGGGRVGGGRAATAPGAAVLGARIYVLGVAGHGCFQVTLLIQCFQGDNTCMAVSRLLYSYMCQE